MEEEYLTLTLINGNQFWTMTPVGYYNPFGGIYLGTHIFSVYPTGFLDDTGTYGVIGFRPVINIRSDVTVSGLGTMQNPYTFSGF